MDKYGNEVGGIWPLILIVIVLGIVYVLAKDGFYAIKDRDWSKATGLALVASLAGLLISLGFQFDAWIIWTFRMALYASVAFAAYHLLKDKLKSFDD